MYLPTHLEIAMYLLIVFFLTAPKVPHLSYATFPDAASCQAAADKAHQRIVDDDNIIAGLGQCQPWKVDQPLAPELTSSDTARHVDPRTI